MKLTQLLFLLLLPVASGADLGLRISPPNLLRTGKAKIAVFADKGCTDANKLLENAKLSETGQAVSIVGTPKVDACAITAEIDVGDIVRPGPIEFLIRDKDNILLGSVSLNYQGPLAPGPIPPGIDPQVDVMWKVMSFDICNDDFGKRVADRFYCIEVVLGNNTGYALQLAGMGFLPLNASGIQAQIPNDPYVVTRAVLQREQMVSARNYTYRGLQAAGLLMAGFVPFYANPVPKSHYTSFVSIITNSIVQGYDLAIPDRTIRQLNNLDDQVMRDGRLIPNNTQWRTIVFMDKLSIQNTVQTVIDNYYQPSTLADTSDCAGDSRPCDLAARLVSVQHLPRNQRGVAPRRVVGVLTGNNLDKVQVEIPSAVNVANIEKNHLEATSGIELTFELPGHWQSSHVPIIVSNGGKRNTVSLDLTPKPRAATMQANFARQTRTPMLSNKAIVVSRNVDSELVRRALSQLVIVGDTIEYKQRIRIDANASETGEIALPPRVDTVRIESGAAALVDGDKDQVLVFTGKYLENVTIRGPEGIGELPVVSNDHGVAVRARISIPENFDRKSIPFTLTNSAGSASITLNAVAPRKPDLGDFKPAPPVSSATEGIQSVTLAGKNLKGTTATFSNDSGLIDTSKSSATVKSAEEIELKLFVKKDAAGKLKIRVQRGSLNDLLADKELEFKKP